MDAEDALAQRLPPDRDLLLIFRREGVTVMRVVEQGWPSCRETRGSLLGEVSLAGLRRRSGGSVVARASSKGLAKGLDPSLHVLGIEGVKFQATAILSKLETAPMRLGLDLPHVPTPKHAAARPAKISASYVVKLLEAIIAKDKEVYVNVVALHQS
jgi:hypothetical protein